MAKKARHLLASLRELKVRKLVEATIRNGERCEDCYPKSPTILPIKEIPHKRVHTTRSLVGSLCFIRKLHELKVVE